MTNFNLIPNVSLGIFNLNDNIEKYLYIPHTFEYIEDEDFTYGSYNFYMLNIIIWTKELQIESIRCSKECFWAGKNLIGLLFSDFQEMIKESPDDFERIYLLVKGKGQTHSVYDFDKLGLQIWVWRKKIRTIIIS